jgi:protein SCO1/2
VRSRRVTAAAGAVAALVTLAGCGGAGGGAEAGPVANFSAAADDGLNGVVLPDAYHLPHVRLTDTSGSTYTLDTDTTMPLTLVFFGYTNCPDVCGVVMANLATALNQLPESDRAKVAMLFVTTDPARDDPSTLRRYLDRYNPAFEGVTGPLPKIVDAGKAVGVLIEKGTRLPSGGYEVQHGTQVLGVLPDGSAPVIWTGGTTPRQLADDLTTILHTGVPSPPDSEEGTR